MSTKLIRLYDYKSETLPAEKFRWRVTEEEISAQLELLAMTHAQLMDCDSAFNGSAAVLSVIRVEGEWNRNPVLVYPGSGLCEELETAVRGCSVGDIVSADVENTHLTMRVECIRHPVPAQIDDVLIAAEQIPQADTVKTYRVWWKHTEETKRRREMGDAAAFLLMDAMIEYSVFAVDEQEKQQIFADRVAERLREQQEMGIPAEFAETEEEILRDLNENWKLHILCPVLEEYLLEFLRGEESAQSVLDRAVLDYAAQYHTNPEQVKEGLATRAGRRQIVSHAACMLMRETYTDGLLEVL